MELTIFQDNQIVLLGDRVDFLPPFQAECRTGGVLAAGDSVKDMREFPLGLCVPARKDSLELLRDETAIVDLDWGPGDALGRHGVCEGREG